MQKELNEIECWKDIPGYEGKYQVSDLGNVRTLNYNHTGEVKVLKFLITRTGYCRVALYKNGKTRYFLVHRVVWFTFKGPIPKGLQINHLNEIKTDNRLENLEVCTPKHNTNYGTRGERAGKAISKALKGKATWNKGVPWPEETRAKMKGKTPWNKGKTLKPHTEETKAKMSAALKCKPAWNKGKPFSEETKEKMRAAQKARREREKNSGNK